MQGDHLPCCVVAELDLTICELQKEIKKQKMNLLGELDASSLTLWKVPYDIHRLTFRTMKTVGNIDQYVPSLNDQKLQSMTRRISAV